jgi:hypothetical protein
MFGSAGKSCGPVRHCTRTMRQVAWGCCVLVGVTALGCVPEAMFDRLSGSSPQASSIRPTSFAVRAQRRAFDGAPPVIPHVPFGIDCVTCHTPTGKEIPTEGAAPANPHHGDPQAGALENCRQCHLFSRTTTTFVANTFEGRLQKRHTAERAHPAAPPVTPHSLSMRTNCVACHAGPAARPEIVCTHVELTNCVQCHLAVDPASKDQQPIFTPVPVPGDSGHASDP